MRVFQLEIDTKIVIRKHGKAKIVGVTALRAFHSIPQWTNLNEMCTAF